MEINKNMTRAEQIGHVYEYTSKYAIYIGSRVKNESDFVETVIEKTYMEADERTAHLWDDYSFEYWIDYFHKKCMESIYDSLDPEMFSFDFCEISEDVIDFEANLKSDNKDFVYDENVSYNAQIKLLDERLNLLSPKQRFALILFYVFDTDLSEIADLYKLKELKVKSILADSRKKLNMPIPFFRWVLSYQLSLQPPKRFIVDDLISNTYYKTGVEQYRPY